MVAAPPVERPPDVVGRAIADRQPEHRAARADQLVERAGVGVDLVGTDRAVPVLDRRVDLEQLLVAEIVAVERVLSRPAGADERCDRPVPGERLVELVVGREVVVDQLSIAIRNQLIRARPGARVRPGEDAVLPPDLHSGDVVLPEDALGQPPVLLPRNVHATVADEQGMHDAVDVAGKGCLFRVQSLALQRAREDRAEHDSGARADERRREQEHVQEGERPLEVAPAPQRLGLVHLRNIGPAARWD